MATPTLTAPASVPFGGTANIGVTFVTAPPRSVGVTLHEDGVQVGSGSVTFDGEPTPVVALGSTGVGWELRATGGTLVAVGGNNFTLA